MKRNIILILEFLKLKNILKQLIFFLKVNYFQFLTLVGLKQTWNYKSIPIIIISFNQLFYFRRLIEFLQKHHYTNIVIIDNNSSYQPLLDYLESLETSKVITIYRLKENFGHMVFWKNKELFNKYSKGYYVVTDADINPDENCPSDFILHFRNTLNHNSTITKVGFSLRVDDIPETNTNKAHILNWESQYWQKTDNNGNYIALTDTTFALYRPKYEYDRSTFFYAIRTKEPYIASHGGWYIDNKNLNEEQLYYFKNCNESSSWRIDEKGNLRNTSYLN